MQYNITCGVPTADDVLRYGLGWDVARGVLPKLDLDLDAFACLLKDDILLSERDIVLFKRSKHRSGCLIHSGDNNSGFGANDDEFITINLSKVPEDRNGILLGCRIFNSKQRLFQTFGKVKNGCMRLVNTSDNSVICRDELSDASYTKCRGAVFGVLHRQEDNSWVFDNLSLGFSTSTIEEIVKIFKEDI